MGSPLSALSLKALLSGVRDRRQTSIEVSSCVWVGHATDEPTAPHGKLHHRACGSNGVDSNSHYQHSNPELGVDFIVEKLGFEHLQVMDARLVQIAPLASNEKHRHAHESIFVVLSGQGDLQIGHDRIPLRKGSVACVPRWLTHQSHNTAAGEPLTLLAITDFGLTSAVLGDYDANTRLRRGGTDAFAEADEQR